MVHIAWDPTTKVWSRDGTALELVLNSADKTLVNGDNNNVGTDQDTLKRITGPTAAFAITGLDGGLTGRTLIIINDTSHPITFKNENGSSSALNRLLIPDGADLTLKGAKSSATFLYHSGIGRWILIGSNYRNREACRVWHNADQTISHNTYSYLSFNQEDFDTDGMHDTVTNNGRITIQREGTYLVGFTHAWAGNSTGIRTGYLEVNRTYYIGTWSQSIVGSDPHYVHGCAIDELSAGDYIENAVFQTSGGNLAVKNFGNGDNSHNFWAHRLSD